MGKVLHTNEEIFACLRRVAKKLNRSPRRTDYESYKLSGRRPAVDIPASTINSRFESWNEALVAAGLEPIPAMDRANMVRCLLEAMVLTGYVPNTAEYDTQHACSGNTVFISRQKIVKEFGSWPAALAFAGLPPGPSCRAEYQLKSTRPTDKPRQKKKPNTRTPAAKHKPPTFQNERMVELLIRLGNIGSAVEALCGKLKPDAGEHEVADVFSQLSEAKAIAVENVGAPL